MAVSKFWNGAHETKRGISAHVPHQSRTEQQVLSVKKLCDRFYKNPPITFDEILNARLHSIYLINIDKDFAKELDPCSYVELTENLLNKSEVKL